MPGRAIVNPLAASPALADVLGALARRGNALAAAAIVLAAISLVVRYRHSDRAQAAQIRWIALTALASEALAGSSTRARRR